MDSRERGYYTSSDSVFHLSRKRNAWDWAAKPPLTEIEKEA